MFTYGRLHLWTDGSCFNSLRKICAARVTILFGVDDNSLLKKWNKRHIPCAATLAKTAYASPRGINRLVHFLLLSDYRSLQTEWTSMDAVTPQFLGLIKNAAIRK